MSGKQDILQYGPHIDQLISKAMDEKWRIRSRANLLSVATMAAAVASGILIALSFANPAEVFASLGGVWVVLTVGLVMAVVLGWLDWTVSALAAPAHRISSAIAMLACGYFVYRSIEGSGNLTMLTLGVVAWVVFKCTGLAHKRVARRSLALRCPHCDEDINLKAAWHCGWCRHTINNKNIGKLALPVESCPGKSCDKTQTAMRCPHCCNDIIFAKDAYRTDRTSTDKATGVAVFQIGYSN